MSGNLTGFRNRFSRDCSAKPAAIVRKTPGGSVASEFISLPIFGTWLGMNSKPYNVTVTSVAAQPGLRLLADDVDEIAHRALYLFAFVSRVLYGRSSAEFIFSSPGESHNSYRVASKTPFSPCPQAFLVETA